MAYEAKLLPSPNWSEAIQFKEASAAKPYPEQQPRTRIAQGSFSEFDALHLSCAESEQSPGVVQLPARSSLGR
jgi:hypothetical protein